MIRVRDDTRRDGLAANFRLGGEALTQLGHAFPTGILNIGYPNASSAERDACERILTTYTGEAEPALVSHARDDHLEELAHLTSHHPRATANFWLPASIHFIRQTLREEPAAVLARGLRLVRKWQEMNERPLDIALTDCTADEPELPARVAYWTTALLEAGARDIIICDSRGKGDGEIVRAIAHSIRAEDRARIEYHPHDDNGNALSAVCAAISEGITTIGTAMYGSGERCSMLDPRRLPGLVYDVAFLAKFEQRYRQEVGDPDAVLEEAYGNGVMITGTQDRLYGREPGRILRFGATSDCFLASTLLKRAIGPAELDALKRALYDGKSTTLTAEELREHAENVHACVG